MTAKEFWQLPEHGSRTELIDGVLQNREYYDAASGIAIAQLGRELAGHVGAKCLGKLVSSCGFVIKQNPDTVLAPAIAFISASRVHAMQAEGFPELAPALVAEAACGETLNEMEEKVHAWLAGGTKLVWLVSSTLRTVSVYRKGQTRRLLQRGDVLAGDEVIPGFMVAVADIFA